MILLMSILRLLQVNMSDFDIAYLADFKFATLLQYKTISYCYLLALTPSTIMLKNFSFYQYNETVELSLLARTKLTQYTEDKPLILEYTLRDPQHVKGTSL